MKSGILNLYKPGGPTSHDMIYRMRRLLGIKKIGHTGTLDPMAEGVLPICIGKGTKASGMLTDSDKAYRATMVLGMTTDTQDADGTVLTECRVDVSDAQLEETIARFTGEIEQIPPMYSAVKLNGKKLYELARRGEEIERPARKVRIDEIRLVERDGDLITLDVYCSKGTYIRTLCADMGDALGCGAYVNRLIRIKSGPFLLENAYTEETLSRMVQEGRGEDAITSLNEVYGDYPVRTVSGKELFLVQNGVPLPARKETEGERIRICDTDGTLLGISQREGDKLRMKIAFHGGGDEE